MDFEVVGPVRSIEIIAAGRAIRQLRRLRRRYGKGKWRAENHGYLRIVDESGEDYGYAADRFFAIDVPKPLEKVLLKTAS